MHSFPAWRSALKCAVWSLHRVWWTSERVSNFTQRPKVFFSLSPAKVIRRINGYYSFINCDLRRECQKLYRPWFVLCRQLGRVPIAGSPLNFFSPPIPWKSSGNPNHVQFRQCGRAEINTFPTWSWNISCFSQSVHAVVAQGEFQLPSMTDIHWKTLKRYLPRHRSLSPTGRLSRTQQASLPFHSHAFCKAARLATPSSWSARNAPTQWTKTLRWR